MLIRPAFIILLTILQSISSRVTISIPQELAQKVGGPIKVAYSDFGKIPYGQFVIGRLYYDLNEKDKDYACKPLTGIEIAQSNRVDRMPIVLIDRGDCSFVTKARNVQKIGGGLALIIDNEPGQSMQDLILTDDGSGKDIVIPTVMISKVDGDKIKEFFMANKEDQNVISNIIVSVEFKIAQSEKVEYQIFFSSANKRIYRLIKEFYPYFLVLKKNAQFTPHYISHESSLYNENKGVLIEHCLSNGKYCSSPRYDLGIQNGKDILLEDIRQKCVYNLSFNKTDAEASVYLSYMSKYYDNCINVATPRFNYECSYEVLDLIGYDQNKVKDCMLKSFDVDQFNELMFNNNNTLLEQEYEVKSKWQVKMFPTILVNNRTVLGAWNAENLFQAVCAGFITKPNACEMFFVDLNKSSSDKFTFGSVVLIILLVVFLNLLIIYVCKKYIMKKIHERVEMADINGRINNVVSSYLALRDSR